MNPTQASLTSALKDRIREHFEGEDPEEIVRQSRQLVLYPQDKGGTSLSPVAFEGPVLLHPRARPVTLNAYLASALTNLNANEKMLIAHLSDIVNVVCRSVDIDLYEPRKKTDPVHNAEVTDTEVFRVDREKVIGSDLLIHLCHFPSTGAGEELAFAYEALVPMVLIAPGSQSVSRMITGIPSLKIDIRYQEPEDMREMLECRLREVRPLIEQRRLAKQEFSENIVGARIKELRLEASLSRGELARRVGLEDEGLGRIEENVDTISNPSLTHLRLIATALKTTVAELVNPDYTESVLSGIQSMLDDRTMQSAAARFRGVPTRDQKTLLVRYLVRLLALLTEPGR
jgi:transcriptional regulator with XRE-family HTH domain